MEKGTGLSAGLRCIVLFCFATNPRYIIDRNLTFTYIYVYTTLQSHINRRPKLSIKLNKWCKLTCIKEEEYCFEVYLHTP